jgi:shikimate dehydrogenase
VREDGAILGDNTDGFGFTANLAQLQPDWRGAAGPAVLLGAGGAARAVVAALLDEGAPEIRLVNRTTRRAEEIAAAVGGPVQVLPWNARADALTTAALLVNSTNLGQAGQGALDLDLRRLPAEAVVCDIVYVPLMTALLQSAQQRGNTIVDGIGMLLHQARPGFRAWFGPDPQVTPELRAFVLEQ